MTLFPAFIRFRMASECLYIIQRYQSMYNVHLSAVRTEWLRNAAPKLGIVMISTFESQITESASTSLPADKNGTCVRSQGAFLTFRPDAFVNLTASSAPGSFDAGDPVQFTFTITHLAQSPPSAYDVELEISLDSLDPNRTTATCDLGVSAVNKTTGTIRVTVAVLAPSKRAECVVNSFVGDRIAPNQLTKQVGHMRYYSQAAGGRPVDFAPYEQTVEARIQMAPVQIAINASQGALELTAGDAVNFTAGFAIPECVTPLSVLVTLPAVPKSVLDRRRRRGLDEDHVGFPDARRLVPGTKPNPATNLKCQSSPRGLG